MNVNSHCLIWDIQNGNPWECTTFSHPMRDIVLLTRSCSLLFSSDTKQNELTTIESDFDMR